MAKVQTDLGSETDLGSGLGVRSIMFDFGGDIGYR